MFSGGIKPSLDEVLNNKEKRVSFIEELLCEYKTKTVVTIKLNIPGEIKNNEKIEKLFLEGEKDFKKDFLKKKSILFEKYLNLRTGPEKFVVVDDNSIGIKKIAIDFEDNHPFGRIFDIDVLYYDNQGVKISRRDLDYKSRSCYICEKDGKVCGGRREHSVAQTQEKILEIIG